MSISIDLEKRWVILLSLWDIKMSIYLSIKNSLLFIMLIVLSAFIYNTQVYADVIGFDADGIVCLNDDLELYSNDFRTIDLDFDGEYELYFAKGHLNKHI